MNPELKTEAAILIFDYRPNYLCWDGKDLNVLSVLFFQMGWETGVCMSALQILVIPTKLALKYWSWQFPDTAQGFTVTLSYSYKGLSILL